MTTSSLNHALLEAPDDVASRLPHLAALRQGAPVFRFDFGLDRLPEEPGLIIVRGPRRYGKSTWIEQQVLQTVEEFGPGTALYLNGDELADFRALRGAIEGLVPAFGRDAPVRRLFIDEVTAVASWERALKILGDNGTLRDVLVVTTGSRATDLRRGVERLPGRRGRLERSTFLFAPISFAEFERVVGDQLGDDCLDAYLLSGGAPAACSAIATEGRIPEYVIEMLRDWVYGEFARTGRDRASVVAVMEQLHRLGGSTVGQAKLAREAGLANNTIAAGYVEVLADLMCVGIQRAWDSSRRVAVRRRPAKFPFTNLLAALAWDPARTRTIEAFRAWSPAARGRWIEWAVAQELWRRAAIRGDEMPEELRYWRSKKHEIDFVTPGTSGESWLEVKLGRAGPLDFTWFSKVHPGGHLTVITETPFATDTVTGVRLVDFLRAGA
jgi:predicted AAA+ superfamily ATPase